MINRKELAICKRRGHDGPGFSDGWMQCKWCGIWRRRVVEEREDQPPEEDMSIGFRTDRKIERMKHGRDRRTSSPKDDPSKSSKKR
jgi:hypothetical protein